MICTSCNQENREGRKFCSACGTRLVLLCSACGAANEAGERFCGECGAALAGSGNGGATAAALATASLRVPAAYTPKHLADKILRTKSALEGERKQVTVLFADVKGSTDLAGQLDPEEWHGILDRFFEILADGVHRFEGTVNQYTGDGIMALFGAPIAHEDHARRACYAALHLVDELRRYANELRLRRGLNFSVRMGLNSGEVIVGKIGDDLRMDYTAQGHTVGLSARMEQIAEPGKVYLTEHTAALAQGYFNLADLGEMDVKGAQAPMHVFELQGVGQMSTRLDVSRSRGFSRFVGRGDEMQVLESALARAQDGTAQVIGIVGDAGLGKSRLCYEFLERCRGRKLMTYETAGVSHGKAIAFLPVLRLFRSFFGIVEQDSDTTARERIAGRLLLVDERLRESLPLLFDFMGVPDPENPAPQIDPEARQRQMFDLVRRVVKARGQRETTVTLLEDLHWFDGGSEAFLAPLIEASVGTRSLILLNFRPEYQAPWMGKSFYHQIPLAPLGADAIHELLEALLGSDSSMAGLADAIHERTAGNPFYMEEVLQNLIESGKLEGSKGAYRLVTSIDKVDVPSSVHALLAARIDRLAEREKDVLQTAAVIGREFDEPTLAAVVEQDAPALREALQKLKDTEFVYEQSLYPVAEYLFKHPLTQEVALNSQLQERRRRLHAAVARVIEAAHASNPDSKAALLAHHWEAAADSHQAFFWHRRAAEWFGARDPVEGIRHWQSVRAFGKALTDHESLESRIRACGVILAGGSWRLGMGEAEVSACLDEARSLANELGRPQAVAIALSGFANHSGVRGDVRQAVAVVSEAREMIDDSTEPSAWFPIALSTGYWSFVAGSLLPAIETFERIIDRAGDDPHIGREMVGHSPLIFAETLRAIALAQAGRFDESWAGLERAIQLAREHDAKENLVWALGTLPSLTYLARGTLHTSADESLRVSLEAVDLAERAGSQYTQIVVSCYLATSQFMAGDYAACEERFTDALGRARSAQNAMELESFYAAVLADTHLALGDRQKAAAAAREAADGAEKCGTRFHSALARTVLVDALIEDGAPAEDIEVVFAEARELVEQTGGKSLLPRLREAEARLAGRADQAALVSGLREAEQMYRAIGAPDPADRIAMEIGGKLAESVEGKLVEESQ